MVILEEETFKSFRYWPSDLKLHSHKLILAACNDCDKIRALKRQNYRPLCHSCAMRSEETKAKMSAAQKGENHPMFGKSGEKASNWQGGPVACTCQECGKTFKVSRYMIKKGRGKYCSRSCAGKAKNTCVKCTCQECGKNFEVAPSRIKKGEGKYCSYSCANKGENNPSYNGGKKATNARSRAKRKRELGFNILMPLNDDEVFHHVTNEYVIGIKKEVHQKLGGGKNRRKHRTRVLQWLKINDKKKYKIVLCVLAKEPLR